MQQSLLGHQPALLYSFFKKLIVTCRLCVIYARKDYDAIVWLHGLYGLHEPGCLPSAVFETKKFS